MAERILLRQTDKKFFYFAQHVDFIRNKYIVISVLQSNHVRTRQRVITTDF